MTRLKIRVKAMVRYKSDLKPLQIQNLKCRTKKTLNIDRVAAATQAHKGRMDVLKKCKRGAIKLMNIEHRC